MNDFDQVLAQRRAKGLPCPQTFTANAWKALENTSTLRGHVLEMEAWLDKLKPVPAAWEMARLVIAVYHMAADMGIPWAPVFRAVLEAEAQGMKTPDILSRLHLIVAQSEDVPHPLHGIPRDVITFIGDRDAERQAILLEVALTMSGHLVFPLVLIPEDVELSETTRGNLDDIVLHKIDRSDAVYVLDVEGHVSERVRQQLLYAESKGKRVLFYSEEVLRQKERIH